MPSSRDRWSRRRLHARTCTARSWAAALALALLAACSGDAPVAKEQRVELVAGPPAREAVPASPPAAAAGRGAGAGIMVTDARDLAGRGGVGDTQGAPGEVPSPAAAAVQPVAAAPAMLIRTGQASVEVDALDPAIAAVRALATRLGGYVANTTLAAGRDQVRSATLQLKVPAARFDDATGGLSPIGRVETVNVGAEDVGEEFVDLSARVANARRLEARLLVLLETRAARLPDILAVERELARVREEIDRAEGRLRYLRSRVALSTLEVTVHEPLPIVGSSPSANPLREALRQAWRNLVAFLAGSIAAMGVLLPLGVIAIVGWRLWRRLRRPDGPPAA